MTTNCTSWVRIVAAAALMTLVVGVAECRASIMTSDTAALAAAMEIPTDGSLPNPSWQSDSQDSMTGSGLASISNLTGTGVGIFIHPVPADPAELSFLSWNQLNNFAPSPCLSGVWKPPKTSP